MLFRKPTRHVLVQDARNQRLVGQALLHRAGLYTRQYGRREANIHTTILRQGRASRVAKLLQFGLGRRSRYQFTGVVVLQQALVHRFLATCHCRCRP